MGGVACLMQRSCIRAMPVFPRTAVGEPHAVPYILSFPAPAANGPYVHDYAEQAPERDRP